MRRQIYLHFWRMFLDRANLDFSGEHHIVIAADPMDTHSGIWMGAPSKDKPASVTGVNGEWVANGRFVANWIEAAKALALKQIGAFAKLPAPSQVKH